jgi:hypothetical protein
MSKGLKIQRYYAGIKMDDVNFVKENWEEVNPSSNAPLIYAFKCYAYNCADFFISDKKLDPSVNENMLIIDASKWGKKNFVDLLLKDKRVDPCDKNNRSLTLAVHNKHYDVVLSLICDYRVNCYASRCLLLIMAKKYSMVDQESILYKLPHDLINVIINLLIKMSLRELDIANIFNI